MLVEDGCVRVGGYRSASFDASSGTAIAELRFRLLTASPQGTITIQNFVDDVEGAAPVVVDLDAVIGVKQHPGRLVLHQNQPNPFNPDTRIRYEIPAADAGARVTLSVYNIEGKLVRRLVVQPQGAGIHDVVWRGRNDAGQSVASGVYFYVLRTGRSTLARKLVLLK